MGGQRWQKEKRDDLSLPEIVHVLWGWRRLVAACVLVLLVGGVLLGLFRERVYTAESVVIIQPQEELAPDDIEGFASDVGGAVDPEGLVRDVMRKVGWKGGAGDFKERLDVQTFVGPNDEPGLQVRFSGDTAVEAADAANAYADLFVQRVEQLNDQRLAGGSLAADARVERKASPPEHSSSPGPLLFAAIAIGIGMLFGGAAALLLESRAHNWRDARDAEITLKAPVLGIIPEYPVEAES